MPEPLLYVKAVVAAAIVSTTLVLAIWVLAKLVSRSAAAAGLEKPDRKTAGETWPNLACVVAIGGGLVVGYWLLALQLAWPPRNGLERFLTLIVPAVLAIELVASFRRVPRWGAWLMRVGLAASMPRILLHGSVYLTSDSEWNRWQAAAVLGAGGILLVVWALLSRLSRRGPAVSISIALQLSTLCTGLTVMMAGYIKGGAAALPLIAALLATTMAARLVSSRVAARGNYGLPVIVGVGVAGLFGLLFIGRFFGQLTTASALIMLLAPLLCWATEIPRLPRQKPWLVGTVRVLLVAIPLVAVLILAKRDFDRDMAPLLSGNVTTPEVLLVVSQADVCVGRLRGVDDEE